MRFYEDLNVGDIEEFGEYQVTRDEVVAFAEQFDPQSFHVDEEAAEDSLFGELVASGWHTASLTMRLSVQEQEPIANMGGIGVDALRWHEPLKPGDILSIRTEILDKRPSESRDDRGYLTTRYEGINQHGDVIISYEAITVVECRGD